jgi:hypothetical protein
MELKKIKKITEVDVNSSNPNILIKTLKKND